VLNPSPGTSVVDVSCLVAGKSTRLHPDYKNFFVAEHDEQGATVPAWRVYSNLCVGPRVLRCFVWKQDNENKISFPLLDITTTGTFRTYLVIVVIVGAPFPKPNIS
jgi:hypothetical protein